MEDHELIKQIAMKSRSGRKAFELLHNKYANFIKYKISIYVEDKEQVNDISQEVWINVMNKAGTFKNVNSNENRVKAWLGTIAKNKSLDTIKSKAYIFFQQKALTSSSLIPKEGDSSDLYKNDIFNQEGCIDRPEGIPDPERVIEMKECVEKAIDSFETAYGNCFRLLRVIAEEKFTTRELAIFLGRKEGAARQYLSHCKKNFWGYIGPCINSETLS